MKPINTANKCMQNCFCEILAHTRNGPELLCANDINK